MVASVISSHRKFVEAQGWHDRISEALLPKTLLKPPDGTYRAFFDADIDQEAAATGVVIFDPDGGFFHASARRFPNISDRVLAETLALEEAVTSIEDLHLAKCCVIGDALQVVQIARNEADCPVICESSLRRTSFMLDRSNIEGPFWVPRDQNLVAHTLANFAKSSPLLVNT